MPESLAPAAACGNCALGKQLDVLLHQSQLESIEQVGHPSCLVECLRSLEGCGLLFTICIQKHKTQLHKLMVVTLLVVRDLFCAPAKFST